jgi:ELWxxDGT repeat protein
MSVGRRRHLAHAFIAALAALATGAYALAAPAQAAPAEVPVTALTEVRPDSYRTAASESAAYLSYYDGSISSAVLWKSDGTVGGTTKVANLPKRIRDNDEYGGPFLVVAGTRAFFVNGNASTGDELWTSDGTSEGTTLVTDLRPGATGSSPESLTVVGNKVFFVADAGDGEELWASDGSSAGGTIRIAAADSGCSGTFIYPSNLTAGDGELWFSRYDASCVEQLWRTDGTLAGTEQVTHFTESGGIYGVGVVGERAFFSFIAGTYGAEEYDLYITDEARAGTTSPAAAAAYQVYVAENYPDEQVRLLSHTRYTPDVVAGARCAHRRTGRGRSRSR